MMLFSQIYLLRSQIFYIFFLNKISWRLKKRKYMKWEDNLRAQDTQMFCDFFFYETIVYRYLFINYIRNNSCWYSLQKYIDRWSRIAFSCCNLVSHDPSRTIARIYIYYLFKHKSLEVLSLAWMLDDLNCHVSHVKMKRIGLCGTLTHFYLFAVKINQKSMVAGNIVN